MTDTRTITETERLQLIGLLTLSRDLNVQIRAIEKAAADVVGEPSDDYDYYGFVTDNVWDHREDGAALAQNIIRALKIEVVPDP